MQNQAHLHLYLRCRIKHTCIYTWDTESRTLAPVLDMQNQAHLHINLTCRIKHTGTYTWDAESSTLAHILEMQNQAHLHIYLRCRIKHMYLLVYLRSSLMDTHMSFTTRSNHTYAHLFDIHRQEHVYVYLWSRIKHTYTCPWILESNTIIQDPEIQIRGNLHMSVTSRIKSIKNQATLACAWNAESRQCIDKNDPLSEESI